MRKACEQARLKIIPHKLPKALVMSEHYLIKHKVSKFLMRLSVCETRRKKLSQITKGKLIDLQFPITPQPSRESNLNLKAINYEN